MIGWVPTASVLVLKLATPAPFSIPLPMKVVPSRKFTVPTSGPAGEVTVAVKVTVWVNVLGFTLEVSIVTVPAWLTTWNTAADVLEA